MPGTEQSDPFITFDMQRLKTVDTFVYLGSTLSKEVHIDDEASLRIAKACMAFGKLKSSGTGGSLSCQLN